MRTLLLAFGFAILFVQYYIQNISIEVQFAAFAVGILILGIPHGAADLLVATQNAERNNTPFLPLTFFVNYMGRLVGFGVIIWLFPLWGNLIFIFLAAYHFGETDLHQFKTDTILGKLLITTYGFVILMVILMPHFDEAKPILQLMLLNLNDWRFIDWLDTHRLTLIMVAFVSFFTGAILYFIKYNINNKREIKLFCLQFALILVILYNLPMLLGFTFYFVVWHSVFSLTNIVTYLKTGATPYSTKEITKQIVIYSALAMLGICIIGAAGFMFTSKTSILVYTFLGLAVLTAPHMQVMHDMYQKIRIEKAN